MAFPFVDQLSPAGRDAVQAALRWFALKPRQRFIGEGEPCTELVFVERGALRVFKTSASGRQITLYRVRAGSCCILSVSAVLAGAPYPAEVEASEDATLCSLPAPVFRTLFDREGAVRSFVVAVTQDLLSGLMVLVAEVAFKRVDERLAAFLLAETAASPKLRTTHDQLARDVGTAREVVSRLLENFQDDGLLVVERGTIAVVDRPGLQRIASDAPV